MNMDSKAGKGERPFYLRVFDFLGENQMKFK